MRCRPGTVSAPTRGGINMNREPHSTLYPRTRDGAASADGSDAQVRCRRVNLLGTSALYGGKLAGLAFVAALVAAPAVFGASPALAQSASGDGTGSAGVLLTQSPCNATAPDARTTAVGATANANAFGTLGGNTATGFFAQPRVPTAITSRSAPSPMPQAAKTTSRSASTPKPMPAVRAMRPTA